MIPILVKLSIRLKPYYKLIHLLALLVIVNLLYQFLFSTEPNRIEDKGAMLSLLALVWLALIHLMLNIFTQIPEKKQKEHSLIIQMKAKLNYMLYYILSLIFLCLTLVLIILSFKMIRV